MASRQVGTDVVFDTGDELLVQFHTRHHLEEEHHPFFQTVLTSLSHTHTVLDLLERFH